MTPEKVRELLAGITPGPWTAATAPRSPDSSQTKADYLTSSLNPGDAPLWVVWAENDSGDGYDYLLPAVTGDGPRSERHAELIAAAPEIAQAYLDLCAERGALKRSQELMAAQFRTMQREKEHGWREAERWEGRADRLRDELAALKGQGQP